MITNRNQIFTTIASRQLYGLSEDEARVVWEG
jgi:hypothetical protein